MMENNGELYIGSITPTIPIWKQRELLKVTRNVMCLMTEEEFVSAMKIYSDVLDRVLKENNIEEK